MKAVILAAGKGTRTKLAIPKPLIKIAGSSLLERTILTFTSLGIREIVIVVGYEAQKVKKYLFKLTTKYTGSSHIFSTHHPQRFSAAFNPVRPADESSASNTVCYCSYIRH